MTHVANRRAVVGVFFLVAVFGLSERVVQGSSITVDSNLSNGSNLSGSVSGQFDVTSFLAGNSLVSASLSFTFQDDGDGYSYGGTSYTAYSGSGGIYARSAYNLYNDPYESVTLNTSSQSVGAASQFSSSLSYQSYSYYPYNYSYRCGFSTCYGTDHYYTYYYNSYSGYSGFFGLSLPLDAAGLADLDDGILSFTLNTTGDARLVSAKLTAVLEPLAVPDSSSTLTLFSMAIVAGGVLRLGRYRRT